MSRKDSKTKPLDGFYKEQLANHREAFSKVEPIITQDGKDQGHQNDIKAKKENKIRHFITKLFRVSHKSNKKVVTDSSSKLDQNNNLEVYDAIEAKIKQMSSKEALAFLNNASFELI
ncbi:hypothetical protein [Rickettsia endosymbiont of Nabis limbatus]|uniref:hypothetical protein n=1 Tax=Rickettsia endosymbiont of Nabis limbatus TaxID=3066268 RepID=UPI003AF3C851